MTLVDNRNNTNPYLNLALEEFLVRHADCNDTDYLLLYINEPCFVLGKNQSIYREVNFEFLRNGKLLPARRISGGGTVYHDEGNVNFAFITKFADHKINNYRWFNEPLIKALNKAGISAETDARNNIICHGKKISGNAQFTNRKNIISHGTLLFSADLNVLRACLAENDFKVETKAVQSVKSSVVNISGINKRFKSAGDMKAYIVNELAGTNVKGLTNAEWQQIEKLAMEKFQSFEWVYGRSPLSTIKRNDLEINVEDGKITAIKTNLKLPDLIGLNYTFESIKKALANCATASEILGLIF